MQGKGGWEGTEAADPYKRELGEVVEKTVKEMLNFTKEMSKRAFGIPLATTSRNPTPEASPRK